MYLMLNIHPMPTPLMIRYESTISLHLNTSEWFWSALRGTTCIVQQLILHWFRTAFPLVLGFVEQILLSNLDLFFSLLKANWFHGLDLPF